MLNILLPGPRAAAAHARLYNNNRPATRPASSQPRPEGRTDHGSRKARGDVACRPGGVDRAPAWPVALSLSRLTRGGRCRWWRGGRPRAAEEGDRRVLGGVPARTVAAAPGFELSRRWIPAFGCQVILTTGWSSCRRSVLRWQGRSSVPCG